MKQPYEGITGADRDDDLLSLDDRAVAHRNWLITMARLLQMTSLVGNPAPVVRRIAERMRTPRPGDLVVEHSVLHSSDLHRRKIGLGILLEHRIEWWHTDDEWAELPAEDRDGARDTDRAWYVQYGPSAADVCRWVDCEFIALPEDARQFTHDFGHRDDTGVTITQQGLRFSLADAGFILKPPGRRIHDDRV